VDAPAVEIALMQDGPSARRADGTVPVGAARAEISLTLPGGSEVSVEHFAMRVGVMTGVLFAVFAEAPGSLTVSQFQVVTDTKTPVPPPPPPEGLCPVTTPGEDCQSEEEKDSHYCPSCSSHQPMAGHHHAVLEGRPVRTVTCGNCGTRLVQNVGTLHHARRTPLLPTFAIPRSVTPLVAPASGRRFAAPLAPLTPVIVARPSPLLGVRGISMEEVRALNRHSVTTLEKLVALDVDALAALLPTGSVTRARFLRGLAGKALKPQ
jgi:ribosomal protein S27AE